MALGLDSIMKRAGIDFDDIARAKEQAAIVRQFIEQTNVNTAAIVSRLAAIDQGAAQMRDIATRQDAFLQAIVGRLDALARTMEELPKLVAELRQVADLVE